MSTFLRPTMYFLNIYYVYFGPLIELKLTILLFMVAFVAEKADRLRTTALDHRPGFFNLLKFTAPLRAKKIELHPNIAKMII